MKEGYPNVEHEASSQEMIDAIRNGFVSPENLGSEFNVASQRLLKEYRTAEPSLVSEDEAKELEAAFAYFGLPSVARLSLEIKEKIKNAELEKEVNDFITTKIVHLNQAIIPPDVKKNPVAHSGNGYMKEQTKENRLKNLLLFLAEQGIDLKTGVKGFSGENTPTMMRGETYNTIIFETLKRVVQISDEVGNSSYVFDVGEFKGEEEAVTWANNTTKSEKYQAILKNPRVGIRITGVPGWEKNMHDALVNPIGTEQYDTPERPRYSFTEDEKRDASLADARGYVVRTEKEHLSDEKEVEVQYAPYSVLLRDNHWLPVHKTISTDPRIRRIDCVKMLNSRGSTEFLTAYSLNDIKKEYADWEKANEHISGKDSIYIAPDGKRWASINQIRQILNVSASLILDNYRGKPIKMMNGLHMVSDGYCIDDLVNKELQPKIARYIDFKRNIPSPEKEGEWKDFIVLGDIERKQDVHWGSLSAIARKSGINRATLISMIQGPDETKFKKLSLNNVTTDHYSYEDVVSSDAFKSYLVNRRK